MKIRPIIFEVDPNKIHSPILTQLFEAAKKITELSAAEIAQILSDAINYAENMHDVQLRPSATS